MIGIRSAISIRARGHRPHLEAVYMTAPRSVCRNTKKPLPRGGRPYMTKVVLLLRLPGLIVAGGLGAAAACQDRAGGPVGHRRPRQVGNVRLFPGMRLVGLFGRRKLDGV